MSDLITLATLNQQYTPPSALAGAAPALITAASQLIERWCKRRFALATYDELYDGDGTNMVWLRNFPLAMNPAPRVRTFPTGVIQIRQQDTTTNQQATISLAGTGDYETGFTVTGLTLYRVASGVPVTVTAGLDFATNKTINQLAAAVNAVGAGWNAQAIGNYGLWPTSDFLAIQGQFQCLGGFAALQLHTTELPAHIEDAGAGVIRLDPQIFDPVFGNWGGAGVGGLPGSASFATGPNAIRIAYQAGFTTVPGPVQQATVETVKAMFERLQTDSTLMSESDGVYSWSGRELQLALPKAVQQLLGPYRSLRV